MQLNISITLSHNPTLLLLDEVTAGLDPIVRRTVLNTIKEYAISSECIVIMTTHNLEDISDICNRLILLNNGSILLDDNFEDKSSKEIELIFRKTLGYGDM